MMSRLCGEGVVEGFLVIRETHLRATVKLYDEGADSW